MSNFPACCVVQDWFQLPNLLLISQATPLVDEACKTNRLEEGQVVWRKTSIHTVHSHLASFNMSPPDIRHCVCGPFIGVCRTMALIGDTKQAMSEGKSGLVETGLTGLAARALQYFRTIPTSCAILPTMHTTNTCTSAYSHTHTGK